MNGSSPMVNNSECYKIVFLGDQNEFNIGTIKDS